VHKHETRTKTQTKSESQDYERLSHQQRVVGGAGTVAAQTREHTSLYPFDHLKMVRGRRPAAMKAVTLHDLNAIWEAAKRSNARDRALVTVMATAGLRAGELISMRLSRLHLKEGSA
jgi:integrase